MPRSLQHRSPCRRVFISEYVAGGAWPGPTLPSSLYREGLQMLGAVVEDFLNTPSTHVTTTLDARVTAFPFEHPQLVVLRPQDAAEEAAAFNRCCREADAVLVIAPEFHGILHDRVRQVESLQAAGGGAPLHLGCTSAAVALCADKLRLAQHLRSLGIPTINTTPFSPEQPRCDWPYPFVIKPRDGAGSVLTFVVRNENQLAATLQEIQSTEDEFEFIQQPFIAGRTLAMSLINGQPLALTEQVLSTDDRLQYLGTRLTSERDSVLARACERLVTRCHTSIAGLNGYVGFDILAPDAPDASPLLVEINPRLTTSYVAYRQHAFAMPIRFG